MRGEQRG